MKDIRGVVVHLECLLLFIISYRFISFKSNNFAIFRITR